MGGGAGCVCGVEAVDEAVDDAEEEGEPTAAAADVCSTTAVATGAEAATSSEAEAGAAAAATAGEGDDEEPGSELWDDSLPGILGNEHTSQRVMSSWFWNVQRLQVHCSPAAIPAAGWGSCGSPTAGADIERAP